MHFCLSWQAQGTGSFVIFPSIKVQHEEVTGDVQPLSQQKQLPNSLFSPPFKVDGADKKRDKRKKFNVNPCVG